MQRNVNFANRGMSFETLIDRTNEMYEQKDIAVINKRPTPIKVTGRGPGGKVTGFFSKPSTVDYDGIYLGGKSIVFEAKSVKSLDRFDLKNIEDHQIAYLAKAHRHGAISFLLIDFEKHRITFLVPFVTLNSYLLRKAKGGRGSQSVPITSLDVDAYRVEAGRVPLDYLAVVNKIWNLEVA
ncbi:Holliday junction resolvase RecU [Paenibacillus mesophilus]|uniref:Holliday junction resolvase RecU n=1 Tax=Paenibacillus mesophilus TaxID=2582849 RepID=UPI00110E7B34|nr:Holliday junction resolvase RecU [Paenibacillus mesophilus]TMV49387.1 Holliday junction resolvase RecU [Paenibacillus mesophilus]